MANNLIITNDGSHSIFVPEINECYHSRHGAIVEAEHVFIKNGLLAKNQKTINILEIGFGTGLNTFLTLLKSRELKRQLNYTGVEAYPVSVDELKQLNYGDLLDSNSSRYFDAIHSSGWEQWSALTPSFALKKQNLYLYHQINLFL